MRLGQRRDARATGFPCRRLPSPVPRPQPGVARNAACRGDLGGAAPVSLPPSRAGVVAAHLRVSRAPRPAQRRCAQAGGGPTPPPREEGQRGGSPRAGTRAAGPRTDPQRGEGGGEEPAPEMLVRGDRGFPSRRELSSWHRVSFLLRSLVGRRVAKSEPGGAWWAPLMCCR